MKKPAIKIDPAKMRPPAQYAAIHLTQCPPSVNKAYGNRSVEGEKGRFKTQALRSWVASAGTELESQRPGHVAGPYCLTARFGGVSKMADIGNLEKPLSDLLVKHWVVTDDRFAQKIVLERSAEPGVHIMVVSTKEVA